MYIKYPHFLVEQRMSPKEYIYIYVHTCMCIYIYIYTYIMPPAGCDADSCRTGSGRSMAIVSSGLCYSLERIVSMFRLDTPVSMCARLTNIIVCQKWARVLLKWLKC